MKTSALRKKAQALEDAEKRAADEHEATREQYERLAAGVGDVAFDDAYAEAEAVGGADSDAGAAVPDQFCDTDACALPTASKVTS